MYALIEYKVFLVMMLAGIIAMCGIVFIATYVWINAKDEREKGNALSYKNGFENGQHRADIYYNEHIDKLFNSKLTEYLQGLYIKRILAFAPDSPKNAGYTIIKWGDGTTTYVRCLETDSYDIEKAVAFCVMKKLYGSKFKSYLKNGIEGKKWGEDVFDEDEIEMIEAMESQDSLD